MDDTLERYRASADEFDRRVREVRGEQWKAGTPCDEWAVRDLVHHVVWALRWVPPTLAHTTIEEIGSRFDGDLFGDDPVGAWEDAGKAADSAFAAVNSLDEEVQLVYGAMSVTRFLGLMTAELAIHAWDLARGIGIDERLDPELVDALRSRYAEEPLYRAEAPAVAWPTLFGPPIDVPRDADPQDRLIAWVGRDPA